MSSIPNTVMPHAYAEPAQEPNDGWLSHAADWGKDAAAWSRDHAMEAYRWGRREPQTAVLAVGALGLAAAVFTLGKRWR